MNEATTERKPPESKEALAAKAVEYIADSETEDFSRTALAIKGMGYTQVETMYQRFTREEINALYDEALLLRRKAYASALIEVDKGQLKRAIAGDAAAGKLMYQRFEKWSEKIDLNQTGDITVVIKKYSGKATPSE